MKTWHKGSRLLAATAALCLAVAGCGGGGTASGGEGGDPQKGGTLTYALNIEVNSLDPAFCALAFDRCAPIFGTLMRYDLEAEKFVGNMAKSFESKDGKQWTLKLRKGVEFTDGTPYDAEAVVYNWDRIKDPKTLSPAARLTEGMTWTVADPLTVKVQLEKPNYQLPWALVQGGLGSIGSPKAIEDAGEDVSSSPVGAGPFVLEKWTRNSQIEFKRNPDYFDDEKPYLDELIIKVISADDQRLNALRSGEIDVDWTLLVDDVEAIEAEGGYEVNRLPLVGGTGLQFNFKDPVASDEGLRKAMLHAFDSQQINDAVYPGDKGVDAFLSPESPYRNDDLGVFPEKDLDEAQRLFDDYLKRTGKSSETITFSCYAGIPALEQVAQLIKSQMEEIDGLTLEIDAVDGATLASKVNSKDFQTAMGATLSQDMDKLYRVFHTDGALNVMSYSNPKVDKALELSRSSNDPDEVASAYEVVNGELSTDGPLRTWRYQTGHLVSKNYVHGIDEAIVGTNMGASAFWEDVWRNQ